MDTMVLALILLIGSIALLIVASYTYAQNSANDLMSDALHPVTAEMVTVKQGKDGKTKTVLAEDFYDHPDTIAILLLSEKGEVLALDASNEKLKKTIEEDLDNTVKSILERKRNNGIVATQQLRFVRMPMEGVGTKVALMDRTSETEAVYFQFRLYIVLAFIIIILLLAVCDFLARRSISPVDEAIRTQQHFIADASHELKTPLTIILANLDIISNTPDLTVRETKKWIDNTKSEAERMSKLVNEMLFLARSDAAMDMNYNFRLIALGDVVNEVVLATEALAFERNITLESDLDENSRVVGDAERLKQVVMILLENATKYVDENGTIKVQLTSTPRRTEVLTITNTGTPIPPDKAEHIFDRFFRAEESRTRETGGYGLGLSIAQNIVKRHNGEVALDYSNENGTRFSVRLPHAQSIRAPELTVEKPEEKEKEKESEENPANA